MTIDPRTILRPSEHPGTQSEVVPCDPFELWRLAPLSLRDFAALGTPGGDLSLAQLRYLAAYDLLAPTSHNTVPQRFVFPKEGNTIEICLDREVVLAASDPSGRQASISLGCGIANLIHAARRYGLQTSVEVDSTRPVLPHRSGEARYARIARVRFERGAAPGPETVLHAMLERRSVRALYDASVKLPAVLATSLTRLMTSEYPELAFHLVSDEALLAFLGDLQELADSTALSREEFTLELGHWLIENDSDSPLGMRGRELGLSDEMTRGVQARLLSEIRLAPEEVTGLAKGGNLGMRSSSAVGIIVAQEDVLRQRVLAGRAFEDLVLTLHQHGFVTAMHAAITEIESANLALQARLGTAGRPIVVFRMGQPLEPSAAQGPHSARPSVQDVTLTDGLLSAPPARTAS
jgi:hypothetical protein